MRYLATIFWALVLGQVVGFLGGALSSTPYDFTLTTIFSLVAALIIIAIGKVASPSKNSTQS